MAGLTGGSAAGRCIPTRIRTPNNRLRARKRPIIDLNAISVEFAALQQVNRNSIKERGVA
jgi:hypothetical protein